MRYFEIGKIVNTHGVRGYVRVVPHTDDPSRFELLDEVLACGKNGSIVLKIKDVGYHKQFVNIKFAGIDDMDSADRLREHVLKIPENLALPLDDDEYYIGDLIGLSVITDAGESLGKIADILFTGANDVYIVRDAHDREILIPALKKCVLDVDIENGLMTVKLPEGLR